MNVLARPAALRRPVAVGLCRQQLTGPPSMFRILTRPVASTVTIIPASQSLDHTALNIREESGNAAADVAKIIAGRTSSATGFIGITRSIASEVPTPVLAFGLAGGLPYLGAGATTVYLAYQAGLAASGVNTNIDPGVALTILDRALDIQVTYGAVMLSFLGALHWGMEFAGYGGHKGWRRLLLGAAPVVFAWPTIGLQPMTALTVQWVGFTMLWGADWKTTTLGWSPTWYSQYRFYLSLMVGTCIVMKLHLVALTAFVCDPSIIGSLAGCSYYGPVAGHGFISRDLELVREERRELQLANALEPRKAKTVSGEIEAVPAGENADAFVTIRKRLSNGQAEGKA